MKKQMSYLDQSFQGVSFYLNRVQPMREFSIVSSLMHTVLKDKKEINSLVEYEHKFYDSMKSKISKIFLKLEKSE